MKRKSIQKIVKCITLIVLVTQLATVGPLGTLQGGAGVAFADNVTCNSGPIAAARSFNVPGRQAATVSYDDVSLVLDQNVLTATTVLTVTPMRPEQVPSLDPGMTNVTKGPRCGYRFGPHPAHFSGPMQVSIPYNRSLIPPGQTEQDIKTFYFDDQAGTWKELERVSVDTQHQNIVSSTDHFTDMINATVTVPDHPQPLSDNPTSLKDIKAADPGAGINLIDPPQANSMGDAHLSYPIEIPAGRGGMQPSVQVSYSSSGGDGWIGVGWDIPIQSISVDTRWGVPRYDNGTLVADHPKETETYMLNGEELTPVFNRGELQDRQSERVFHTRVEGSFNKIVRHGDSPTNYWWEVTDKMGTRYFYGGDPTTNGPRPDSTLRNGNIDATDVNIFKWALHEVRDVNGNTITYHYDVVDGHEGGTTGEPWHQIYLRSIRYTGTSGTGGSEGPYEILFNREGSRQDVSIDGRAGFEIKSDQRLASIVVNFITNDQPSMVRKYTFQYRTGQFSKSLLTSVKQYGEGGEAGGIFNQHTFDYYDDVATANAGVLQGFKSPTSSFDNATYFNGTDFLGGDHSTALHADDTTMDGGGGSIGISALGLVGAGVGAGGEHQNTDTKLTLIDLNGDGLLDQLYEKPTASPGHPACGKSFFYRPNVGGPSATPDFGPEVRLSSLEGLCATFDWFEKTVNHDSSSTFNLDEHGNIGPLSGSHQNQWTDTSGEVYMSDVNADGLPDLVVSKDVFFNHLQGGTPTFDDTSPTPLEAGTSRTDGMDDPIPQDILDQMQVIYHLVDPVRRWTAPYNGSINITGQVHLLAAAPTAYSAADGVRVSVQKNGTELWSATISDPRDLTARTISGLASVPVSRGDNIYFRVNSRDDGRYDAVAFDPTITYNSVDTTKTDENGMSAYVFSASSDFAFGGLPLDTVAPITGTATLTGVFQKDNITTDDVTLHITKFDGAITTEVFRQDVSWDQTGSFPVTATLSTNPGDRIRVRIGTDSRIDLTGIHFTPRMVYNTVMGQPAPVDEDGNPAIVLNPNLSAQVFPQNLRGTTASGPYQPWIVPSTPATGTLQLRIRQSVSLSPSIPSTYTANIALEVKRAAGTGGNPERLAKQRIDIRNGAISGSNSISVTLPVERGDVFYFEADATTPDILDKVTFSPLNLTVQTITTTIPYNNTPYDLHAAIPTDEAFGGGFRGWWQGQYNGRNATSPIDESELRLPTDENDDAINFFVQMIPFPADNQWRMQDEDTWISATDMSSSRLGRKNLDVSASFGGRQGIIRKGGSDNEGASISVPIAGASGSSGSSWSRIDFLDFNGDGYPDVVGNGKLQSTLPNGALAGPPSTVVGCTGDDCDKVRNSKSESISVNVGQTVSQEWADAQGELMGIKVADPSVSISAGLVGSTGNFRTTSDLVDVNGDGLPDLVRQGDDEAGGLIVQLNLGYRFAAPQPWNVPTTECTALVPSPLPQLRAEPMAQVRCQKSVSVGASASIGGSVKTPSFGFSLGGGVSDSLSFADTQQDLVDVNGDGLADVVSKTLTVATPDPLHLDRTVRSTDPLRVRINTGTGFTDWYTYTGALNYAIGANVSHSFSVGANAGISIPMPWCLFLCSLDIGGSYSHAHTLGGFNTMLSDLDGDGYADHIYSDYNGNVTVSLNNHGRTNLLKSVHRPLGGRIDLDYSRTGDTTDQPGNRWALSKVTTFDGHDGDGDVTLPPPPGESQSIKVTQVTTISYSGGKYDRAEREFYGFRTVTTSVLNPQNSALYRTTTATFKNGNYYERGLLESQVTKDAAGHKFNETVNSYDFATVDAGQPGALADFTATRFPRLVRTDQRFYEGQPNPGKSTYVTYNYDDKGNVISFFDAGDEATSDDVTATIAYASCPAKYIVGKPNSIVVTSNGHILRRREADINCNTGLVDDVKQYLDDDTFAQTDLAYFDNGNLESVTGPANATGYRYAINYTYDDVVDSYVTGISDSFGYSSAATYNFKFGQLASSTDLNHNVMSYTFDPFGRVLTVRGPYEQTSGAPATIQFGYHPEGSTPWALTRHYDPYRDASGNDTIDTVLFTDGFKRVLQTKKDGTVYDPVAGSAQNKTLVSGAVRFDFAGRAVSQYYPTTEASSAANLGVFNNTPDTITPTLMTYDVLDRNTTTTTPDGAVTATSYGFGDDRYHLNQFETTVEDANHNRVNTFKDVQGLTTSVQQFHTPDGGTEQSLWTSYGYDPMKELVEVKDAQQNVTSMVYDNLGRRTSLNNPDTGRTTVTYDLASNMTSKVTADLRAENRQVTYTYDRTRLTGINFPDNPANNVRYTYGAPDAPNNRAGRIATVTDGSGSEDRFYGKLGETTREVRTVNTNTGPAVYTTLYTYDTWGRVQNMTYPDGEVLTYTYDAGGQVKSAIGVKGGRTYHYIDRMEYDKFEQRAFVQDGNGIETNYTYRDDNHRLSNIMTGQGDGNPFQNLGYTYDAVGNVTNLTNVVAVAPPSQFGGPTTQTFGYDDLYRLTDATGSYQFASTKSRQYSMSMEYDSINNILSKDQADNILQNGNRLPQQKTSYNFDYTYTPTQPHAPTHIDDRSFTYDANGNQTGWTNDNNGQRRSIVWDEENRIQSISDNGRQETFKYDDAGTRVIKRGPQGETVYVNAYFTIRNGQVGTKNIYMGDTRVVSKLMKQDPTVQERDLFFYHPDNLGSSNYVTDANGHVYEHMEYFPFGETWVEESSNTQHTNYMFSSKELDEETGLYYYGARYYDPRTSVWQSVDPALPAYVDGKLNGGVFNPVNLSMYTYAMDNPVKYVDPTGMAPANRQSDAIKLVQGPIRIVKPTLRQGPIKEVKPTLEMGEIREVKPTVEMGEIREVKPTVEMGEIREVHHPTMTVEMGEIREVIPSTAKVKVTMGPIKIESATPAVTGALTGWASLSSDDTTTSANPPALEMGEIREVIPSTAKVTVTIGPITVVKPPPAVTGALTGWSVLPSNDAPTRPFPSMGKRDRIILRNILRSVQWPPPR